MQNPTGLINDGLQSSDCSNNGKPAYTYNQGVILGGLADMYQVTGDTLPISSVRHGRYFRR